MDNCKDASSSSEDEILAGAFREACDEQFLPQSLFAPKNSTISEPETKLEAETKPSLRVTERSDNFESFGVSQSFKDYVAKKLDAILEQRIVHQDVAGEEDAVPKKRRKKNHRTNQAGIKLLGSSDDVVTEIEESKNSEQRQPVKRRTDKEESEATNLIKCHEVAVDANWILSKNEVKHWSERCKGALYKYKKGFGGVLIEQA